MQDEDGLKKEKPRGIICLADVLSARVEQIASSEVPDVPGFDVFSESRVLLVDVVGSLTYIFSDPEWLADVSAALATLKAEGKVEQLADTSARRRTIQASTSKTQLPSQSPRDVDSPVTKRISRATSGSLTSARVSVRFVLAVACALTCPPWYRSPISISASNRATCNSGMARSGKSAMQCSPRATCASSRTRTPVTRKLPSCCKSRWTSCLVRTVVGRGGRVCETHPRARTEPAKVPAADSVPDHINMTSNGKAYGLHDSMAKPHLTNAWFEQITFAQKNFKKP